MQENGLSQPEKIIFLMPGEHHSVHQYFRYVSPFTTPSLLHPLSLHHHRLGALFTFRWQTGHFICKAGVLYLSRKRFKLVLGSVVQIELVKQIILRHGCVCGYGRCGPIGDKFDKLLPAQPTPSPRRPCTTYTLTLGQAHPPPFPLT